MKSEDSNKNVEKVKYKGLDILKFICAIFIACIYHYRNDFPSGILFDVNPFIRKISLDGWLLVELFFIISGFFFFISYHDKIKSGKINFDNFFKSRYIRLIPVAAFSTIIMFFLQNAYYKINGTYWIWGHNDLIQAFLQMTGLQYWSNFSGCSLNNVTWYISVLLICYTFYYGAAKLSNRYGNKIYLLVAIISLIGLHSSNIPFMTYYIARGLLGFGIGILIGILSSDTQRLKICSNISIIVLVFLIISMVIFGKTVMLGDVILVDLISYPILVINLIRFEFIFKKISSKITNYLSNLSFGIYIYNLPLQLLIVLIDNLFKLNIRYDTWSFFRYNSLFT